eukprot:TRINITY_DN5932_c0_g1_i1.p1 TRINITY_DN5932_c0_g1~~TRINITY_DN5932_c0_g1_i1.p1  ORF type:complete len:125 (+),score=23.71 TRINITY_DN5932_c0_g1_i1:10-384(+)
MGGIFSNLFNDKQNNNNQNQITEHDRAVLSLKTQRDSLKKFMKKYTELTQKEEQLAKQFLVQGKRDKAKLCLKKKKCQEKLLHDTETNLTNIEEMVTCFLFLFNNFSDFPSRICKIPTTSFRIT